MNPPDIKEFIRENSSLFWWIKEEEKENISIEFLVEMILNYGNEKNIKKLFALVGIERVANIFYKQIAKKRVNYIIGQGLLIFSNYTLREMHKEALIFEDIDYPEPIAFIGEEISEDEIKEFLIDVATIPF